MIGILYEIRIMSSGEYRTVYIRATDEYHAAKLVNEKINGDIRILSIEAKGVNEDGRSKSIN